MTIKQFHHLTNFIICILLLLFIINKIILRPIYGDKIIIGVILGSLPNLIGSFTFSVLPINKALRLDSKKGKKVVYFSSIFVFLILVCEEFTPFLTGSKVFDIYDIIASGIGAILAIVFYQYISINLEKEKINIDS